MIRKLNFDFRMATFAFLSIETIGAIFFTLYLMDQADKINQKASQTGVTESSLIDDSEVASKHQARSIVGRAINNSPL